jgi:hypothetical protein
LLPAPHRLPADLGLRPQPLARLKPKALNDQRRAERTDQVLVDDAVKSLSIVSGAGAT